MALTGAVLRGALAEIGAVGRQLRDFDELAAGADAALRQAPAGLTANGAASWLATQAQESDYFRTTVEYGRGQRYAPFIGRTFDQVTWRENYAAMGDWCHARGLLADPEQFVRDPASLGDYRWAWLGGVWYFEVNRLWDWANAGDHRRVSQAVNGGRGRAGTSFTPNHWDARLKMFRALQRAGAALLPGSGRGRPTLVEGDTGPLVGAVITFANKNFPGYDMTPILLLEPPRFGPGTHAFVVEFQTRVKRDDPTMKVDGKIGPQTWGKLEAHGFRG